MKGAALSDLGWHAEGIERSLAAGGVELETYRRPGFAGGIGVRRSSGGGSCFGWSADPEPYDSDEDEDRHAG